MTVRMMVMAAAAMLAASPALAMVKVSNLSDVPQTVVFSSSGTPVERVVEPGGTERFAGTDGFISLKQHIGTKQPTLGVSGGVLSGIVDMGAVRTQDIPTTPYDEFVIWPDGRLLLQKRGKAGRWK